jgi:Zn-finger nucleic acid-binding protein
MSVRETEGPQIDTCMKCGGAWVGAHELDAYLAVESARPRSISESPSADEPGDERFDRFSFNNKRVHAAAFPVAIAIALAINKSGLIGLLTPFHIWIHEFGHAIPAWLAGYRALPLPVGWTSIEPERSVVVYFAILFLLSVLFWTGQKQKLRGAMVLAVALAIAQFMITWRTHPQTIDRWIYFSGVGGEFFVSAFLMIAFYFQMPDRFRWDFWRYVVLVIAASAFFEKVTITAT